MTRLAKMYIFEKSYIVLLMIIIGDRNSPFHRKNTPLLSMKQKFENLEIALYPNLLFRRMLENIREYWYHLMLFISQFDANTGVE